MVGRAKDHLGVTRILNWQPSLPTRMERYNHLASDCALKLPKLAIYPPFISLIPQMPPVRDQGQLGACTAFSCEAPLYVAQVNAKRMLIVSPSPLFLYYNERLMNGTVGSDSGANISDIYRATNEYGTADESLWPYNVSKYTDAPPQSVYAAAVGLKAHIYAPVPQLRENLIGCIHHGGFPVNFGITVYQSFMDAADGIIPMPGANEAVLGGHALAIVGYNDDTVAHDWVPPQHFIGRNSWGTGWGQAGYFAIPFDYVLDPQLASDMWMIRSL